MRLYLTQAKQLVVFLHAWRRLMHVDALALKSVSDQRCPNRFFQIPQTAIRRDLDPTEIRMRLSERKLTSRRLNSH